MTVHHTPLASRVDHVIIEAEDEAAVFSFFTETLALPVAWPVAQWDRFHEGGASVGNCNLGCNHYRDSASAPAPTVRRIALEPTRPAAEVIEELDGRDLLATAPIVSGRLDMPDVKPYAPWQRGWTVVLPRSELEPSPFICAYDHEVSDRLRAQEAELHASGGGRLGITGLKEVLVETDDVEKAVVEWLRLLQFPAAASPGVVGFASGPQLRFVNGSGPPALVFGVRELRIAAIALAELGITSDGADELRLEPSDALGLDLRLVEDQR